MFLQINGRQADVIRGRLSMNVMLALLELIHIKSIYTPFPIM